MPVSPITPFASTALVALLLVGPSVPDALRVARAAESPPVRDAAAPDEGVFDPFGFDATLLVPCPEGGPTARYARRCEAEEDAIDAAEVDTGDWTFEPDPGLRRVIVEAYASRMDAVGNPDAARNAQVLRRVDLIAVAGEALARFGLDGSNLADVMGVHVGNLHDAATEAVVESTPENAAALARQMAAVLAVAGPARLDEPGERQRVADALIIDAVLLGARTEACASGKAAGFDCGAFRARAGEIGRALYGVELADLALGDTGLRPR